MDSRIAPRRTRQSERLDEGGGRRWRSRPVVSTLVRLVAVLGPAIAAAAASLTFSRLVRIPQGNVELAIWWAVFFGTTILTWLVSVQLLQRLLPLAALLNLTLLFPDTAPSRFAVLRRQASPRQLERELKRTQEEGPNAEPGRRAQTILELAAALSVHDSRTRGHSERVRMFTDLLAQEMHLEQSDADRLRWAALLHDIGKLTVAPEILNKPGKPDSREWEALHGHPMEGYRLTAPLHEWLGPWADAVRDHHERFDGTGYPRRRAGEAISLSGRIVAVADSYETMTAARPYKPPIGVTAAREELVRMSGSHFDPLVVRAFLNIALGSLWRAIGFTALITEIPVLTPLRSRLSNLGVRFSSATIAAAVTAAVLLTGVVTPPNISHARGAPTARVAEPGTPAPQAPPSPEQGAAPLQVPPGSVTGTAGGPGTTPAPGALATAPVSGSGTGPPVTSQPSSSTAAGAAPTAFPAGIAKQSGLPPGVANNPNAFAGWRLHH
jgi:HD-GYP domain-containing protein (c-di-GMP phosphodiesterase class II)